MASDDDDDGGGVASSGDWEFVTDGDDDDDDDDDEDVVSPPGRRRRRRMRRIRNILVCGDGDLSYSAGIASELESRDVRLVATVLEDEDVHNRGELRRRSSLGSRIVRGAVAKIAFQLPGVSCPSSIPHNPTFFALGIRHTAVYQYSKANANVIASAGHGVAFGVDATYLSTYFGGGGGIGDTDYDDDSSMGSSSSSSSMLPGVSSSFDRVQFNFPHWRGKANNRYNRILLGDFLASAVTVLSPGGEIHVALCDGQGG
jgi:hypothetical protein